MGKAIWTSNQGMDKWTPWHRDWSCWCWWHTGNFLSNGPQKTPSPWSGILWSIGQFPNLTVTHFCHQFKLLVIAQALTCTAWFLTCNFIHATIDVIPPCVVLHKADQMAIRTASSVVWATRTHLLSWSHHLLFCDGHCCHSTYYAISQKRWPSFQRPIQSALSYHPRKNWQECKKKKDWQLSLPSTLRQLCHGSCVIHFLLDLQKYKGREMKLKRQLRIKKP